MTDTERIRGIMRLLNGITMAKALGLLIQVENVIKNSHLIDGNNADRFISAVESRFESGRPRVQDSATAGKDDQVF